MSDDLATGETEALPTPAPVEDIPSAQADFGERRATALAARYRRQPKSEEALPRPATKEDFDALASGAEFIDPNNERRVKPYYPTSAEEYADLPEGVDFIDPNGDLRTTPKYEPIDFTAQTLYNMSVNDRERRKALERSYPGKVKENEVTGRLFVDDDGTLRAPKGFGEAPGAAIAGMGAPVVLGTVGAIGGGVVGSAVPVAGTVAGTVAGGASGGALGQFINDMVLQLAGVYDRSQAEAAGNIGMAAATSAMGAGVGRGIAAVVPATKGIVSNVLPTAAAKFLGATKEGLETAIPLADKGILVPPSGWAKEAPHIQNITEVFDPAFRTQKPLLESATKHYEESAGGILETMGVTRAPEAGPLSKPTAEVSTLRAGDALKKRALDESAVADGKLREAMEARKAEMTAAAPSAEGRATQLQTLEQAEVESRKAAQNLIDAGFQEIQGDIDTAMKVAKAGGNSGDLWWSVGEKLKAVKRGIQERANVMYGHADELAGANLPDAAGLPQLAERFLAQLPEGFEGKYPSIVKQLRDLAGEVDEAGKVIREPVTPTFGQLHNLRSILRQNYNSLDLTPDIKQGVFKFFANRVDDILQNPGAHPDLKAAATALREADTFYRESMGPLTDKNIQAVMNGLESGMPADPKNLFDTLIKEGRSDLTNKVRGLVGPNLWAGVKAADIQEMLDLSKTLVPDVIDGRAFAKQVLDRHRHGMLEAVHGREATQKLIQQAQNIEMLAGRLDINVRPGDTVSEIIGRARQAAEAVRVEAAADPLKVLGREMKQVDREFQQKLSATRRERRNDPLGFLYEPTTGATQAVDKILGSEDLVLAAAAKFGEKSPEFEMLRQIYAQRVLEGTLTPGKALAKMSPELQSLMFPGGSLDAMKQLAKDMDFLMSTRGVQETAKSMAAQAKVEHPWSSIPGGKMVGKFIPGVDQGGRYMLESYYKLVTNIFSSPSFLRWVQRGLNGDPAARAMVREEVQRAMQRGGAVGAGVGESLYQAPTNENRSVSPAEPVPDRRSSLDEGRTVSDASEYPVEPGQRYAMDIGKRRGNLSDVPAGKGRGEGGAGGTEKAFEQIRKENAGLTREQRREQMRREGQKEFDRVQDMSDADYEAELNAIRGALKRK